MGGTIERVSDAIDLDRHVYGDAGAAITVIEYGDFECPYCGAAMPVLRKLIDGSAGRVRLIFRHFPVFTKHPYALTAALAAEASGDRFWPMHDRLFSGDEPHLRQADLRGYAEEIGIPPHKVVWPATQFVEDRVEADFNSGVRNGVHGTPTFFVDGRLYRGDTSVKGLLKALQPVDDRVP